MKPYWYDKLDGIMVLIGLLLIILATALLNIIAAIYVTGVICILLGVLIGALDGKKSSKEGK